MTSIVTDETLNHIRDWLEAYAQQFMAMAPTAESRRAMMGLKLAHSRRVAAEARGLATELGWDNGDQNTAEALGSLHDTTRMATKPPKSPGMP
jgi:HD superfamily phosphodiesterase